MNEDDPKGFLSRLFAGWNRARENPVADVALGFTPAGVAADVQDAAKAIRDRDALGVALASAGFIPGVGDVVKGVGKGLRRAASDLPMDEASRLARAREMGFDTEVFHATRSTRPFDEFRPQRGPQVHDLSGVHVGTLKSAEERARQYFGANPSFTRMKTEPNIGSAPSIMPLIMRSENPFTKRGGEFFTEGELRSRINSFAKRNGLRPGSTAAKSAFERHLSELGHDVIPYINAVEGRGDVSYLVLNPNRLRSRFAAFDPAQRESANLLAGTAGAMIGGSALARALKEENKREEK